MSSSIAHMSDDDMVADDGLVADGGLDSDDGRGSSSTSAGNNADCTYGGSAATTVVTGELRPRAAADARLAGAAIGSSYSKSQITAPRTEVPVSTTFDDAQQAAMMELRVDEQADSAVREAMIYFRPQHLPPPSSGFRNKVEVDTSGMFHLVSSFEE
ncbi:hypothetical protein BZA05DRAFT_449841 [Tricharina praecox]|uniref:uncharacterized protein n=1 Tax=Tricharina praecox TaxID=43433 RepID=UPI00221FB90B|nr:uncharacterized protein BZA05DRAFT_449841 [Tricharina praecox]KAI5840590.1 hypothetical protein BZA05DRAFT_449841 [Tricharina praecox]